MSQPVPDEGFAPAPVHDDPAPTVPVEDLPSPVAHGRSDDELEAESVKWNVARIVRLSSGRFALFTHYRESTLALIKVGTIEEIAPYIPTADECALTPAPKAVKKLGNSADLLADLGL